MPKKKNIARVKGTFNFICKSKGESMYTSKSMTTSYFIWGSLTGESMHIPRPFDYERRLSDTEILWQVKVCIYRSHLSTNFICQTLRVPYRCKNTLVEAIWRLTTPVRHTHECYFCEWITYTLNQTYTIWYVCILYI